MICRDRCKFLYLEIWEIVEWLNFNDFVSIF